jgi:hypothetical protein
MRPVVIIYKKERHPEYPAATSRSLLQRRQLALEVGPV